MASNDYNIYINVANIQVLFSNICQWMSHVYKPDLSRLSQEMLCIMYDNALRYKK